jgi:hypothetical protein
MEPPLAIKVWSIGSGLVTHPQLIRRSDPKIAFEIENHACRCGTSVTRVQLEIAGEKL